MSTRTRKSSPCALPCPNPVMLLIMIHNHFPFAVFHLPFLIEPLSTNAPNSSLQIYRVSFVRSGKYHLLVRVVRAVLSDAVKVRHSSRFSARMPVSNSLFSNVGTLSMKNDKWQMENGKSSFIFRSRTLTARPVLPSAPAHSP